MGILSTSEALLYSLILDDMDKKWSEWNRQYNNATGFFSRLLLR